MRRAIALAAVLGSLLFVAPALASPASVPDCSSLTVGACYAAATAAGYTNFELVPLHYTAGFTGAVGDVAVYGGVPNQCPLAGHAVGDSSGCSGSEWGRTANGTGVPQFTIGYIVPGTYVVGAGCADNGWWARCDFGPDNGQTIPARVSADLAMWGGSGGTGGGDSASWAGVDPAAFAAGLFAGMLVVFTVWMPLAALGLIRRLMGIS